MDVFLGIDVGSVTTKFAALDTTGNILHSLYTRTHGRPIQIVQQGLKEVVAALPAEARIAGVGTTGSARYLTSTLVGADVVKNEITCHAVGASFFVPDVQTILEIGGQDSKIIVLRDGVVTDFAMNTVCAAGTGSFLDQQAARLSMPIEDFGPLALKSKAAVRIAGRCTVFAESDMIHKQQVGHKVEDILYGLCEALARNFINNLGLGKEILPPIVFQGGVATNDGVVRAFEANLNAQIVVPPNHKTMGAIGAALLAQEQVEATGEATCFKGFAVSEMEYSTSSFECKSCSNLCEIIQIKAGKQTIGRWGGRCDKWDAID